VDRRKALTATVGGHVHHFCSPDCRERFLAGHDEAAAPAPGRRRRLTGVAGR
jgi:hypothetical protein